jgi:hypothetical protein
VLTVCKCDVLLLLLLLQLHGGVHQLPRTSAGVWVYWDLDTEG